MPGSWEILAQRQVLVCVLHTETVTTGWALALKNLIIPGGIKVVAGMPFDHARNVCCQAALQDGYQFCLHLDSDVIAPPDTILRLMSHGLDCVGGMYCRRSPPHSVPVAIKDGKWLDRLPGPGESPLVDVDMMGAGCLLLSRKFLETMAQRPSRPGKPWFDWRADMGGQLPPDMPCLSEDFTMMHNARMAGFRVVLDTGIRCHHVGYSAYGLGTVTPFSLQ